MNPPTIAWIGTSMILVAEGLTDIAQSGGTLGGQALLFGAVVVLGWVIKSLFNGQVKSNAELMIAAGSQREEDRKHHQEIVDQFRNERATNIAERGANFQTLLVISRDSAVALAATATAANAQAQATKELGNAIRELIESTHQDALAAAHRITADKQIATKVEGVDESRNPTPIVVKQ